MQWTHRTRWQIALLAAVSFVFPHHAWAASWVRVETPNFIVVGEASEKRIREVAEQFERFRQALSRVLPGAATTAAVPTIVIVFDTQRSFEPYRPRFNGKPIELAGYFVATNNQNLVALAFENRERALRTVEPRADGGCLDCGSNSKSRRARGDRARLPCREPKR